VRFAFTEHKLKITSVSSVEQTTTQIFEGDLVADLESTFIGFTAQSDMFTSRFDVTGIHFDVTGGQTHDQQRNVVFDELPRSNYLPEKPTILRNPYFEGTARLLEKQQAEADGEGRFTDELVMKIMVIS
jgi:hypothetical protein